MGSRTAIAYLRKETSTIAGFSDILLGQIFFANLPHAAQTAIIVKGRGISLDEQAALVDELANLRRAPPREICAASTIQRTPYRYCDIRYVEDDAEAEDDRRVFVRPYDVRRRPHHSRGRNHGHPRHYSRCGRRSRGPRRSRHAESPLPYRPSSPSTSTSSVENREPRRRSSSLRMRPSEDERRSWCYYHRVNGTAARNCKEPCDFWVTHDRHRAQRDRRPSHQSSSRGPPTPPRGTDWPSGNGSGR